MPTPTHTDGLTLLLRELYAQDPAWRFLPEVDRGTFPGVDENASSEGIFPFTFGLSPVRVADMSRRLFKNNMLPASIGEGLRWVMANPFTVPDDERRGLPRDQTRRSLVIAGQWGTPSRAARCTNAVLVVTEDWQAGIGRHGTMYRRIHIMNAESGETWYPILVKAVPSMR